MRSRFLHDWAMVRAKADTEIHRNALECCGVRGAECRRGGPKSRWLGDVIFGSVSETKKGTTMSRVQHAGRAARLGRRALLAAGALVLVGGLVAVAAGGIGQPTQDADGTIHGCYHTENGQLRVLTDHSGSCLKSESPIAFNQPQRFAGVEWLNHFSLLPGDSSVTVSYNAVDSGVGSGLTGLVVHSSTTGDTANGGGNKVVEIAGGPMPGYHVTGVRLCYENSSTSTFIDDIRLAQVQNPPSQADVAIDDATAQNLSGPQCYDSKQVDIDPATGAILLDLRVKFASTNDVIVVRGLGFDVAPA
jgi:hypothetical protein